MDDIFYMELALEEARAAFDDGEVPVGCVITDGAGIVIGRGRNACARQKNALSHAELVAINEACGAVGDFRLSETTLFVTIEPCPMCAGAIVMSRVRRVVFGARNPKAGCAGSIFDILREPRFNHRAEVTEGICAEECGLLMTEFFKRNLRRKNSES